MSLQIRLPADVHEELAALADAEDRSLNGQIVHVLRGFLATRRAWALRQNPESPPNGDRET